MAASRRLEAQEGDPPTLFLIFAGLHRDVRRGTGDLVAVLASEDEARRTFREVRLRLADRDGWAELTAVSDGGTAKRLSWFGVGRWPASNTMARIVGQPPAATTRTTAHLHRWRARRRTPETGPRR